MIGLVSGTVTAAARSLGHYIALSITGFLMLIVGGMLWRDGKYKRDWMADEEEYGNKWGKYRRWAPTIIFAFAYPLIIASPLQHEAAKAAGNATDAGYVSNDFMEDFLRSGVLTRQLQHPTQR